MFARKNWYKLATSQAGKVFLITGANSGIGKVAAIELAKHGAQLVLACRSVERTKPVLEEIAKVAPEGTPPAQCWEVELASLDSVNALADRFISSGLPLHVLINNAGMLNAELDTTKEGLEPHFAINYLSHFLLTLRLLDVLKKTPGSRIVNVSSMMHEYAAGTLLWDKWINHREHSIIAANSRYSDSKWCQVVFNNELHERLQGTGVSTYALHPGAISSGFSRNVPWFAAYLVKLISISEEAGATTTLLCATSPDVEPGKYYAECNLKAPRPSTMDKAIRTELWNKSLELSKLSVDPTVVVTSSAS